MDDYRKEHALTKTPSSLDQFRISLTSTPDIRAVMLDRITSKIKLTEKHTNELDNIRKYSSWN